jgi:hypothetical protein
MKARHINDSPFGAILQATVLLDTIPKKDIVSLSIY